jgi:hypothetical protein
MKNGDEGSSRPNAGRVGKKIWGRKMILLGRDDLVKWRDSA